MVDLFTLAPCINCVWVFSVNKTSLPMPAKRLFCLYIQWIARNVDAVCKEGLWGKKCIFAAKFLVYRGEMKCSESFFRLTLSEETNDSPGKQFTSFPLLTLKCCYLQGKLGKHYKVRKVFLSTSSTKFPPRFQTWNLTHSQNSHRLYFVFPL